MLVRKEEQTLEERALGLLDRHWKLVVLLVWLAFCAMFIVQKWTDIRYFALGDTDDNMRIMQVRALLHGQGWFDLRNYRMDPPYGASIHWSRLVDLPIAGLILGLRPFLGGAAAERWAVAVAPMLPYLLLLFSIGLTARRLIDPHAYPLAFLAMISAGSTNGMFMPERIDHHGWQLALLALSMAGLADPRKIRGGVVLGISSALSLAIGLEMVIYLAVAGVAMVLFWVADLRERDRVRAFAVALTGTTALCFLLFVSYDNRSPICDALSPVWLSDVLIAGALAYGLTLLSPADWRVRLGLALGAGIILAGFHALTWPECLQRLERVSPEEDRLWLSHVKEARPFYTHGWRVATLIIALPITGFVGWCILGWLHRDDARFRQVIGAAIPGLAATLLLFWQTRTGPAAEMLAAVGCGALTWYFVRLVWNLPWPAQKLGSQVLNPRAIVTAVVIVVGIGAAVPLVVSSIPEARATPREAAIGKANGLCNSLWGFHPIALQPKGIVFTFVDLGPRLIAVTHHDAIAGPYHRNGEQIVDVMNFWRGSADQAHRLAAKYHANYVLSCPKSSTTTIFMAEAPQGFYGQLERGQVPNWLRPVTLPKDSPFKMWKIVG